MATSGTSWWISDSLTSQNLGENIETGEGGESLREAWITSTSNYDNTACLVVPNTYTQFFAGNNIFQFVGQGGGNETRVGFIDYNAYGLFPYDNHNLYKTVTGSFNVLTDATKAIILGQATRGTVYIQGDDLNSFHTLQDQHTLNINKLGYNAANAHFRDTAIGDGKGEMFFAASGSTQSVVIGGPVDVSASTNTKLSVSGGVNVSLGLSANTNTLVVDEVLSMVSIGVTPPSHELTIEGSLTTTQSGFFGHSVGIGTTEISEANQLTVSGSNIVAKFLSSDDLVAIQLSDDDSTGYINVKDDFFSIGKTNDHTNDGNINIKLSDVSGSAFMGIGTSTFGTNDDVNLIVNGSISSETVSAQNVFVADTFYNWSSTQLGDGLADDNQTFWGNIWMLPMTESQCLSLCGAPTYGDPSMPNRTRTRIWLDNTNGTDGGGMLIDGRVKAQQLSIGTTAQTHSAANAILYDLYVKGTGTSRFHGAGYSIENYSPGAPADFFIGQKDVSYSYGLTVKTETMDLQGSADGSVKMGIGCAAEDKGLKIHSGSDHQGLKLVSDSAGSYMKLGPDASGGAPHNNEIHAYGGDLDLWASSTNRVLGLNTVGDSSFVNMHNDTFGGSSDLTFKQNPAGNWVINNEATNGSVTVQVNDIDYMTMSGDKIYMRKEIVAEQLEAGPAPIPFTVYARTHAKSFNIHGSGRIFTQNAYFPITGIYRLGCMIKWNSNDDDENMAFEIKGWIAGVQAVWGAHKQGGHGTYKRTDYLYTWFEGNARVSSGTQQIKFQNSSNSRTSSLTMYSITCQYVAPGFVNEFILEEI